MAQQFKLKFPTPGIITENDRAWYSAAITGRVLAATAVVLLVALVLVAELRLTPEQRMDLLEVTTYAAP
jgi:hypothetical protein